MASSTTIAVAPSTRSRLESLKVPGLTFDDVINFALDHLDPRAVKKLYEDWQKDAFAKLQASGRLRQAKA